jgi:hypothetical protein
MGRFVAGEALKLPPHRAQADFDGIMRIRVVSLNTA